MRASGVYSDVAVVVSKYTYDNLKQALNDAGVPVTSLYFSFSGYKDQSTKMVVSSAPEGWVDADAYPILQAWVTGYSTLQDVLTLLLNA